MSNIVGAKASQRNYPEQVLIPRTPHSRAGSFKEHQATEPLLQHDEETSPTVIGGNQSVSHVACILRYFPLVTALLCGILLFGLTIVSYRRPEVISWITGDPDWDLYKGDNGTLPIQPVPAIQNHTDHSAHPDHADFELVIDYSNYTRFPLTTMEYAAECWKLNQKPHDHGDYWAPDHHGVHDVIHYDSPNICSSSITYMPDGEIGLVADLALIAQLAGMARERNRTFFIDDTYWNRGRWLDCFEDIRTTEPGPEPNCLPPPSEELVACPRLARHWVVTSHTAKFHLVHDFNEGYEDPYKQSVGRQRPILEMGRKSLMETIRPKQHIIDLIYQTRKTLREHPYVGVHIRRGDQAAMSWRYHKGYVPTHEYVNAIVTLLPDIKTVYIATDVLSAVAEFTELAPEEWNVHTLSATVGSEVEYPVDRETEGYFQKQWEEDIPNKERIALTRGMIVDLALVTGAWADDESVQPVAVVCTLSSHVCKLAAMTLGWERAMEEKRWVEIDNRGDIEPVWSAFQLYH